MSAAPTPPELPVWRERARPAGARRPRRRIGWALLAGVVAAGLPSPVVASSGGGRRITDAENTRTVYLVVAALVLLAVGLAVFTWWFWRATRRDHEALAPLEVMADRKFRDADPLTRQVMLDQSRPIGAAPLAPGAVEPLLLPAAADAADAGENTPVPTVVAVEIEPVDEAPDLGEATVAADPDAVTTRTAPPAAAGDVTTAIPAPTLVEADVETGADAVTEAEADVETGADAATEAEAASEETAPEPASVLPDDGDAVPVSRDEQPTMAIDAVSRDEQPTMAIDAVAAIPARPAEPRPVVRPVVPVVPPAAGTGEPSSSRPANDEPQPATNGATVARHPIDPGLPQPDPEPEPPRHLSLAELVALDADRPLRFDDNELNSTPSTGIPVIESAEAWVERQLAQRSRPANGTVTTTELAGETAAELSDADDR